MLLQVLLQIPSPLSLDTTYSLLSSPGLLQTRDAYIQKIGGSLNTVTNGVLRHLVHTESVVQWLPANLDEPIADTLRGCGMLRHLIMSQLSMMFLSDSSPVVTIEGTKSGNKFVINGKRQPYITFVRGQKYIFSQADSSNVLYPLTFYRDEAKKERYEEGVIQGTDYIEIQVPQDGPTHIYYDSGDSDLTMGNICYLAGEYQDTNAGEETFLPMITTRAFNFTEPDSGPGLVAAPGEFFAWHTGNYVLPITDEAYEPYENWTIFYFPVEENDIDDTSAPNWNNVLRSVERDGGRGREYTTITTIDSSGTTVVYRVMFQEVVKDMVHVSVEYVSKTDDYGGNIKDLENKRVDLTFTTPPALPGDTVISS